MTNLENSDKSSLESTDDADNIQSEKVESTGEIAEPAEEIADPAGEKETKSFNPLLLLIPLLILATGAAFLLLRGVGGEQQPQLLYVSQRNTIGSSYVNTIGTIRLTDGAVNTLEDSDVDAFGIKLSPFRPLDDFLASGGEWLAFYRLFDVLSAGDKISQSQIVLSEVNGKILYDELGGVICLADNGFCGFSPDGRYFAYTSGIGESEGIHGTIVNEDGKIVTNIDDAIILSFFPDSKRVLISIDRQNYHELSWFAIETKERQVITTYQPGSHLTLPAVSADGSMIYYFSKSRLLSVDLLTGAKTLLMDFGEEVKGRGVRAHNKVVVAQSADFLGVFDSETQQVLLGQPDIAMSNDGLGFKEDIYQLSVDEDQVILKYEVEAGTVHLLLGDITKGVWSPIAIGEDFRQFEFAPDDSRILVFTSGYLATINANDSSTIELDRYVSSFTRDGDNVYYVTTVLPDKNEPNAAEFFDENGKFRAGGQSGKYLSSDIYRINLDGSDKELVAESLPGIVSLLGKIE